MHILYVCTVRTEAPSGRVLIEILSSNQLECLGDCTMTYLLIFIPRCRIIDRLWMTKTSAVSCTHSRNRRSTRDKLLVSNIERRYTNGSRISTAMWWNWGKLQCNNTLFYFATTIQQRQFSDLIDSNNIYSKSKIFKLYRFKKEKYIGNGLLWLPHTQMRGLHCCLEIGRWEVRGCCLSFK